MREFLFLRTSKQCNLHKDEIELNNTHLDHMVPLAVGGSSELDNLHVLRQPCHTEKCKIDQEKSRICKSI